jgi:tartrate dehydratase beta subunit/fumarate hydratase class I family protein
MDSEGHIIYYTVSTPDPQTAIFLSQGPPTAPKFRLTYHLEGTGPKAIMTGKFQMAAPGSEDYHSYLEWSGSRP